MDRFAMRKDGNTGGRDNDVLGQAGLWGNDVRDDLFAATPPLEAIKFLISSAASQKGIHRVRKLMFIDVSKAYFHAPCRRPVYVKLPAEALEPGNISEASSKEIRPK